MQPNEMQKVASAKQNGGFLDRLPYAPDQRYRYQEPGDQHQPQTPLIRPGFTLIDWTHSISRAANGKLVANNLCRAIYIYAIYRERAIARSVS